LLLACGLRRHEAVALRLDHLQTREEHWAIVDLVGKGGHVRTGPVPDWVRTELDDWLAAAAIDRGKLFRRVNKVGRTWGDGMTVKAVWHIVKESAKRIRVAKLSPHDLRRTCAALPYFGRRVGADPIPFGARFGTNDGALPWVQ
jgi:integrase